MSSLIYLARHGETPLNAAGRIRGRLDPPLNGRGQRQASALARALGRGAVNHVIASPLRRALETAEAVARVRDLPVEIDDRFNDRDYGKWTGATVADVIAMWGSIETAPGVESSESVTRRALNGFVDWSSRADLGAVVIVSHDAVNRALLAALDPALLGTTILQETGCYNVMVADERRWLVQSVNNVPPIDDPP